MLIAPLGEIEIIIDDKPIPYSAKKLEKGRLCQDLDGRYSIEIHFVPDGNEHTITCRIKSYSGSEKDSIESGENLELKSFYKDNVKLSLGMEGDSGYILGKKISDYYDYDNEYLDDGVQYLILSTTKTHKYVFGIAWIENCNEDNDIQTWFGADPTLC